MRPELLNGVILAPAPNSSLNLLRSGDKSISGSIPVSILKVGLFVDPTDKEKKFVAVQVRFKNALNKPVSLENIKKNPNLNNLPLIKQSRLSVMPIDTKSWKIILKMSNINKK